MKLGFSLVLPFVVATAMLGACGGGGGSGGDGAAPTHDLYVGYYWEDAADNSEDPTAGVTVLNLPKDDGSFSGSMYFTYEGCQTSNVGKISGTKTADALAGDWAGTIDGTAQTGGFVGGRAAADENYSGTYTVDKGKQPIHVKDCIDYYIASKGTWELFAVEKSTPPDFTIDAKGASVSFVPPPGSSHSLVGVLDPEIAKTPDAGNPVVWQWLLDAVGGTPTTFELKPPASVPPLRAGREYVVTVMPVDVAAGKRLGFASKRFIAP